MQTCRDTLMFTTHFMLYVFTMFPWQRVFFIYFKNHLENLYFRMWRAGRAGEILPL